MPFHERLQAYERVREKIFSNRKCRSAKRARAYWSLLKCRKLDVISSIAFKDGDIRAYASVEFLGKKHLGLLDSGATASCLGSDLAKELLSSSNLKVKTVKSKVSTADGARQSVAGSIKLDVAYNSTTKTIEFYLVPSLSQDVYLGVNFFKTFGVATDLFAPLEIESINDSLPVHELSSDQELRLKAVIACFPNSEVLGLGKTSVVEHIIEVGDAKAVKQRHFPVSPAVEKLMGEELDRMLRLGVIEESTSAWSSPAVLVRKGEKNRCCLDSRTVNAVTKRDAYPLPHIEGIFSRLLRAEFISCLDLKDAFWQIPLEMKSRKLTAFTVPNIPL